MLKLASATEEEVARAKSFTDADLPSAYEGDFGPEAKRRLEMLENELNSLWPHP